MEDEGFNRLPKDKISSSKSQCSGGRQQILPNTPSTRSNVYSDGFEEAKKLPGKSPTSSSLGEKIRSSLPNIGQHLRRLMKFKSHREVGNERETSAVAMSPINTSNPTQIEQAQDQDDNRTSPLSTETQEFPNSSGNLIEEDREFPAIASASSAHTPSLNELHPSDHSLDSNLTMTSIFLQPVIPANLMISSGVEASLDNFSEQMALASVVTEDGAIISAGDPLDFAAALNAQLGYDRIRTYAELQARRDQEPRSIPLLFFQDEPRSDSYIGSSMSGEHGSSTSGSENSIENSVSEVGEDSNEPSLSGLRTRNERDEAQQFYDAALRAAVRKRFRHLDDEPPIY